MSVVNENIKLIEVVGELSNMYDFVEYLNLLGYGATKTYISSTPRRIRINIKEKVYTTVYSKTCGITEYNVQKDAEKIDELISGPNKNLTEARDEFYKALRDIEVNEPEEVSQTSKEVEKWWYKTPTNGKPIFEANTTLGQNPLTPNECHKIKNAPEKDLSKEWNELHNIPLGVKHNQGKLPIDTVLTKQFPNAVEALVRCSVYGHEKYKDTDVDWQNFRYVEGGSQTYADAAARHNQNKSEKDEESGLPHIFHKLWNVMAEVELWIEEKKDKA